MQNNLITYLQLFFIGMTFSLSGPCLFSCLPIIITYISGSRKNWKQSFKDISIFVIGRFIAYLLLGLLAGASVSVLNKFVSLKVSMYFRPIAGIISIILGVFVLLSAKKNHKFCFFIEKKNLGIANLFLFGLIIGISPCIPLLALLSEITLISRSPLDGLFYTFFFGLGTSIGTFVIMGISCGIFNWVPQRIFKSEAIVLAFRFFCAILLILFGIFIIYAK